MIKKLCTLLALAFCLNGWAQYVAIPDSNFVHYLKTIVLPAFKGDSLDTTSTLVITTTHTINVSSLGISNLTGISYFKSLQYLNCKENYLTIISLPSKLKYLDCSLNGGLNIPTLPDSLHYFNCTSSCWNPPTYFPTILDTIIADASGWSSIPTLPSSLVYLDVNADFIECFPPFPPSVQYADISGNFCYCLPNYPMGLITNNGYPLVNLPLCGPGNTTGCPVAPSCTASTVSYTLVADAAPHTWDAYPTYPANVDSARWYWGDGTDTTALYPSHTYSVAGTYSIFVMVGANGCVSTYNQSDSVYRLANNSPLSSMIYINVKNSAAGIKQITNGNELKIYPNPNNGSFVIEPQNTLYNVHCIVYDVNGKMVLSQSINGKTTIDASTLNEGVYNISLQSTEGVINKRVVIVR